MTVDCGILSGRYWQVFWEDLQSPAENGLLRASVWTRFSKAQAILRIIYALLNQMPGFLPKVTRIVHRSCRRKKTAYPVPSIPMLALYFNFPRSILSIIGEKGNHHLNYCSYVVWSLGEHLRIIVILWWDGSLTLCCVHLCT
ncbi:hypothetical protein MKMG_01673 [Methanogenium sp. MK-MG]|nr:hypothetical protein MKMG_01673 [Methanogenium sp. MK-MG]